jgi:FtsH-binding integral membrane protein
MAYVPPSGQEPGTRESRSTVMTKLLLLVGILLLLPGLCTLLFAGTMFLSGPEPFIRDIQRGDPILGMVMMFWGICLLISLGGFFLVRHARSRTRRS